MLTLGELAAAIKALADLGASPAVQALFLQLVAKMQGVSQGALEAFVKAEQEAH